MKKFEVHLSNGHKLQVMAPDTTGAYYMLTTKQRQQVIGIIEII